MGEDSSDSCDNKVVVQLPDQMDAGVSYIFFIMY